MNEVCEICKKNHASLLCDMPTGTVVRTYGRGQRGGVEQITITCDKKVCSDCAVQVNEGIHFCKECVNGIKRMLEDESKEEK